MCSYSHVQALEPAYDEMDVGRLLARRVCLAPCARMAFSAPLRVRVICSFQPQPQIVSVSPDIGGSLLKRDMLPASDSIPRN